MVFGNMDVDLTCPSCKRDFKIKVRQIRDGEKVICPNPKCKRTIRLKVEGDDLSKPDKELNKLLKKRKDIKIDF